MITLELVKLHLRVDGDEEDDLIRLYYEAAVSDCAAYLNRPLHKDAAEAEAAVKAGKKGGVILNAAIRNIGVYLMLHDGLSQPCFQEFLRNGGTCGKGMSLSQWPGSVFYASGNVTLRVTWSRGAPLPELLQFFEGESSLQSQSGV